MSRTILVSNPPSASGRIVVAGDYGHPHADLAAHLPDAFGTRLPHHPGSAAWIAEGLDQRFDDFSGVFRRAFGKQRVDDRAPERQPFDALRGPVRGYVL